VKTIVIDEISMCGQKQLTEFLAKLEKDDEDRKVFGGMNVVMTGDFFQLPPVKDTVLYKPSGNSEKMKPAHVFYTLVCEIQDVICFKTNRRTGQQEYAELQDKIRLGTWDAETIRIINTRLNAPLPQDEGPSTAALAGSYDPTKIDADYCPTIVCENKTRLLVFEEHMRMLTAQFNQLGRSLPILVMAELLGYIYVQGVKKPGAKRRSKATNKKYLNADQYSYLETLPDKLFDRMPVAQFLFYGAYVLFSHNLGVNYGIANGSRGRIVGWQFPLGTAFEEGEYHGIKVTRPIGGAQPDCVFIELANPNIVKRAPNQPQDLPQNVIAIPMIQHHVKEPIDIPISPTETTGAKVRITQLPFRQAQVLTTHAVQGNQYKRYIIAEQKPANFYIQFSRGSEGLQSITMKHSIDEKFLKKSKPKQDLIKHMEDLQLFHENTIHKLRSTNS
jgi:hypothetical protein